MMTSSYGNICALLALCAGNSPMAGHKGQLRGALTFSLICARTNGWAINQETGDSRSLWRYCNERGSNAGLWCFLFVIFTGLFTKQSRSRIFEAQFPAKGQWRGAFIFSLIWAWILGRINNCEADDLRRHRPHYNITVMYQCSSGDSDSLTQSVNT